MWQKFICRTIYARIIHQMFWKSTHYTLFSTHNDTMDMFIACWKTTLNKISHDIRSKHTSSSQSWALCKLIILLNFYGIQDAKWMSLTSHCNVSSFRAGMQICWHQQQSHLRTLHSKPVAIFFIQCNFFSFSYFFLIVDKCISCNITHG